MNPRAAFFAPLTTGLLASLLVAQATCNDLGPFVGIAQQAINQLQLPGMVLRLDQHGHPVLLRAFGSHQVNTTMPIASGSKALAAAVLLSLVDQHLVGLDDPVCNYLPEFAVGAKHAITLRMCFAHTSGLPTFDTVTTDTTITMRQAAARIAQMPLHFTPGTAFEYGNVSMQVAGAVCEVVTGLPWYQLFLQRIGNPLGMTSTTFHTPPYTWNPGVGDGAFSNAEDYSRFLDMLRRGGEHHGLRVLSTGSVGEMLRDQMGNRPVVWTPHPTGARCGLGLWLERRDALGRTLLACAPGAFGFFGWLDAEHDATGIWLATTYYAWSYPYVQSCWQATDVALAPVGITCLGNTSPPCAAPPKFYAPTWARAGQPDFGMRVVGAPPSALGGAWFAIGPPAPGVSLVDLVSYVPAAVALIMMPTDAAGVGALHFGIPAGLQGTTCTMQGFWQLPVTCGSSGLVASRALRLDIGS